jgi:hypothetical protein
VVEPFHDMPLDRRLGFGLRDLFGAAAVVEPFHDMSLGRRLGFGLRDLRLQTTRVQPGQYLAAPHTVALLDQHGGNPLAVVERQRHLP